MDALCERYRRRVLEYVRGQLRGRDRWAQPEDVVQQVLSEVFGRLERLPDGADEGTLLRFLFRTAWLRSRDALRPHRGELGESAIASHLRERAAEHWTDGAVTREDERRWLHELVVRLPVRYAEVVRLCALDGMSYVAAAEELGLEADAVRKRYEKARSILRNRMAGGRNG